MFTSYGPRHAFGTYRLCEQRGFRRACASAQSRQNLRCSLIQAVSQAEPSDRKPDPWPLWMARHAQLKFVMTECSNPQIRLTGLIYYKQDHIHAHTLQRIKPLSQSVQESIKSMRSKQIPRGWIDSKIKTETNSSSKHLICLLKNKIVIKV